MIYSINGTYLCHSGIKGMKWGIRRYQNEDGTLTSAGRARYDKQVSKTAKKDAERYLKAKQFYGEGAGTKRKLLKGELDRKMKDPTYKKYFDNYVNNGDMLKATRSAQRERAVKDTAKVAKRVLKIAAPIGVGAVGAWYAHKSLSNGGSGSFSEDAIDAITKKMMNVNLNNLGNWKDMYK